MSARSVPVRHKVPFTKLPKPRHSQFTSNSLPTETHHPHKNRLQTVPIRRNQSLPVPNPITRIDVIHDLLQHQAATLEVCFATLGEAVSQSDG